MATLESQVLEVSLEAAFRASQDAEMTSHSAKEVIQLNEQWVQSYVGIAINDLLRKHYSDRLSNFVTFETSVGWLESFGVGVPRPGTRPKRLSKRSRFDITTWSNTSNVSGLIEIKDQPNMQYATEIADPEKICQALQRWEKLKWGIFLFSLRSSGSKRNDDVNAELLDRYKETKDRIKSAFPKNFIKADHYKATESKDSALKWAGVIFRSASK